MKNIWYLLFILMSLLSCSKTEIPDDGRWGDVIQLSTKEVALTAAKDSAIITTKGSSWWLTHVSFQDSIYAFTTDEDIPIEADSYQMKTDAFTIAKRNDHTIFIMLHANTTGADRTMALYLEAGDYFDHITIKQSAN
ncbi:hypothetical protein ACG2LH_02795 [Zhouia sp. PK063]|uniref:hypothetical protein n=1 Tax=Zhouia sp. PK063 TaxID=3373602 RepID=UPI00378E581F